MIDIAYAKKNYQIVKNYNQINSRTLATAHIAYDFPNFLGRFRGWRRKDVSNIFHLMALASLRMIKNGPVQMDNYRMIQMDKFIKTNCKKGWDTRNSTFYALACKLPYASKSWRQSYGIDGFSTFEDLD